MTYAARAVMGAAAGLLATAPMTAFMFAAHRRLPWTQQYPLPPRQITMNLATSVGLAPQMDETDRQVATGVAHFGYGAAMGAIYGAVCPPENVNVGSGIGFGLGVWATSYLGLLPALDILPSATEQPPQRTQLMIAAHVVWGIALGSMLSQVSNSKTT